MGCVQLWGSWPVRSNLHESLHVLHLFMQGPSHWAWGYAAQVWVLLAKESWSSWGWGHLSILEWVRSQMWRGGGVPNMHSLLLRWDEDFTIAVTRVMHCDVNMAIWLVFWSAKEKPLEGSSQDTRVNVCCYLIHQVLSNGDNLGTWVNNSCFCVAATD